MTATIEQFKKFARGKEVQTITGNRCVIYTRVSTKDQADNNMSLVTQKKLCEQFCNKQGLEIIGYFGGTYESAKTDERKEFNNMLSFIKKSKQPISQIIVYSIDRFSRSGANAIYIKDQLKKQGVTIQSVTQPADTNTSSGRLQQNIQLIFSDFDNELRRDKCVTGMREALLRGEWVGQLPKGYDNLRVNGKRKIVLNAFGKKLKQIFEWKAYEGISLEEIKTRLEAQGVNLPTQRISDILKNPFNCGILVNNLLEGKVVEGNHEKMVSKELFLKANAMKQGNPGGYKITIPKSDIPLKHFLKCDECNQYLSGYKAKKNQEFYYKCSTKGCSNNRRAECLNEKFIQHLNEYIVKIDDSHVDIIKKAMADIYAKENNVKEESKTEFQSQLKEIKKKIERLEERFINEEMNREIFEKFHKKLQLEKDELEEKIQQPKNNFSNLEKSIEIAIHLASKLNTVWTSSDYHQKQQLQNLVFPEGITYNRKKDTYRTIRANSVFVSIAALSRLLNKHKIKNPDDMSGLSVWVGVHGFEPRTLCL